MSLKASERWSSAQLPTSSYPTSLAQVPRYGSQTKSSATQSIVSLYPSITKSTNSAVSNPVSRQPSPTLKSGAWCAYKCASSPQTWTYFFPTIFKTLGYGKIDSLLLTAPVYVFGFITSLSNALIAHAPANAPSSSCGRSLSTSWEHHGRLLAYYCCPLRRHVPHVRRLLLRLQRHPGVDR
jgi:hypothetical protein